MITSEVRIMELPAMKYVSFHGFGAEPEGIALSAMFEWAAKHEYFQSENSRCFGFNNPDPTPGSSNYGYEVWLAIPEDKNIVDKPVQHFEGGLYAVINCSGKVEEAESFIPSTWKKLVEWAENSPYQMGKHQWLEEQLPMGSLQLPEMYAQGKLNLDLYLPINKS
jgi:AraC family transcriptional regulator